MTTIVADAIAGVMCSDSHWTDGTEKGPIRKVWRIDGALVGFAGDVQSIALVRHWMARGCKDKPPPGSEHVTALIMRRRKLATWTRQDGITPAPLRYAIGTGGVAARGALAAGAAAVRALSIAKDIDAKSSGRSRVYRLGAAR